MKITEIPIGTTITVRHRYLVAEVGYWSWEEEIITGVVESHYPQSISLNTGTRVVFLNNAKDEII